MAVTKIKPVKSTLSKALDYIENPDKTDGKIAPFCVPLCCRTFFSDLREVNSLRSKVFASRKFTKG